MSRLLTDNRGFLSTNLVHFLQVEEGHTIRVLDNLTGGHTR